MEHDTIPAPDADDPLRRRHYENPPVIEGIARFQWPEPVAWSFTTPGLLFERLRSEYPGEPQVQAQVSAGMVTDAAGGSAPNTNFEFRTGPERVVYSSGDGSKRLVIGARDISVHALPPYEGWESMVKRLVEAVDRMASVLGPRELVERVGVRYVNRVEIPSEVINFEDYLTIGLSFPAGYPTGIRGFLDRVEMVYDGEETILAFTWASTDAPPGSLAFILDLDLYTPFDPPVSTALAYERLQDLKRKEGRAFEALLKDPLREQFREVH